MKCPYCDKELEINEVVFHNVRNYQKPVLAVTRCCNHGVMVGAVISYRVTEYTGTATEDDWGNKIKRKKSEDTNRSDT